MTGAIFHAQSTPLPNAVFCSMFNVMTMTQTVEIPDSRLLHLDLEIPREIPAGKAQFEFKVIPFVNNEYTVTIAFDNETQRWYAQNDDIPIILEDDSVDKLIKRVKIAAPEMLEINNLPHKDFKLLFTIKPQTVEPSMVKA